MLSLSLHIDICSTSVQYTFLCFPPLCILTCAVFQFCIFDFGFLISVYWHLQYLSSLYFKFLWLFLHTDNSSVLFLYIWLCFSCLCILTVPVFQFCIFYFAFLVSVYFISSVSLLYIEICSILVLYLLLSFPCLGILTSTVFQFFILLCLLRICILTAAGFKSLIFYFAFLVYAYWRPRNFSSIYFTLLSSSLHIDTCSNSVFYISLCFPCLCILTSAVFSFCIFSFAFLVSA